MLMVPLLKSQQKMEESLRTFNVIVLNCTDYDALLAPSDAFFAPLNPARLLVPRYAKGSSEQARSASVHGD